VRTLCNRHEDKIHELPLAGKYIFLEIAVMLVVESPIKKPLTITVSGFRALWWSWRDLNPRPQDFFA
jgi:hypothetical protein